jgi:sugar O-acyltransferase (sialic acid O-acetyltransferase NeuD family)
MNKQSLILIGAGGHARACIDVIEQHNQFQIAGLVGMAHELSTSHFGYSVIAMDNDLPALSRTYRYAVMGVGHITSPDNRIRLYQLAIELGFQFPVIISPTAYVSPHAILGEGTIVMHGAIVNAGAKIGINCIINSQALIEHDATVSDHCHISTGAILNGSVCVGAGSFVGSGSVVKEGVEIGQRSIVGMGRFIRHSEVEQLPILCSDKI